MSMISTLHWVRRGVAKEQPEKVELDAEDIAALVQNQGDFEELEEDDQEDEEEWSDMDTDMGDADDATNAKAKGMKKGAKAGKKKGANAMDSDSDEDSGDEDLTGLGIDFESAPGEEGDGVPLQLTGLNGLVYHMSNDQDPYITMKDVDEDEIEDFTIRPTDNLILVGQSEEEHSRVEVYVYEEAEQNCYVHHDILVGGMPLAMEWIDYDPAQPETPGNLVAVGTMLPTIDIWDLDVVDGLEPVCTLGVLPEIIGTESKGKKKGKKGAKAKSKVKPVDTATTHVDAVLSLSWNKPNRNLLASGSADKTVKLWDLSSGTCAGSFTHHTDKVQSVQWNPAEPTVLLTGSYDRTACVLDARAPAQVSRWHLGADVESLAWNPFRPEQFVVSLDNGMVVCCDARNAEKPLYTIHAHDKAACSVSFSAYIPDCMVTSGADKIVKVWDVANNAPACLHSEDAKLGPVYTVGFSPDSPFVVAAGGGKGKLRVWDIAQTTSVQKRFADRLQALQQRQ